MREKTELQKAFGEADARFQNNVFRVLATIQDSEKKSTARRASRKFIAAVALICLLITGTAMAAMNTWGILDFLTGRRDNAEVSPYAQDIVQSEIFQAGGETDLALFRVREAIFDGKNVYLAVEVKPAWPDCLLLGPDTMLDDMVSGYMGPFFDGFSGTVGEFAQNSDMSVVRTGLYLSDADDNSVSLDFFNEADGTLVYMLSGGYASDKDQAMLDISCTAALMIDGAYQQADIKRATITATVENSGAVPDVAASVAPAEFYDCGIRVDKVTLTRTPMAIYAEIEFTVTDEAKYAALDSGLLFEFIDESGERLPMGALSAGGAVMPADDSGLRFILHETFRSAAYMPCEVTLRGFNYVTKERYEAHAFEMR